MNEWMLYYYDPEIIIQTSIQTTFDEAPRVTVKVWRKKIQDMIWTMFATVAEFGHTHSPCEEVMQKGRWGWSSLLWGFAESETTLEKALWVKGKAWRQKQTPGEVSDQL